MMTTTTMTMTTKQKHAAYRLSIDRALLEATVVESAQTYNPAAEESELEIIMN